MVEIKNLTKKYKKNVVLDNVCMSIPSNQITFLMGENGAGKTSLIKSILNLEEYQGQVLFDDKTIAHVYGDISAVYDDSPLYMHLNGYENINLLCNRNINKREANLVALQLLNESELQKKVKKYSYGQRKKLAIIIAFLNNPKYIFMDEVSNGLDYETMKSLKEMLKEYAKTKLIFLTGHQFDFYNEIVNNVLVIKNKNIANYEMSSLEGGERDLGWIYENRIKNN